MVLVDFVTTNKVLTIWFYSTINIPIYHFLFIWCGVSHFIVEVINTTLTLYRFTTSAAAGIVIILRSRIQLQQRTCMFTRQLDLSVTPSTLMWLTIKRFPFPDGFFTPRRLKDPTEIQVPCNGMLVPEFAP